MTDLLHRPLHELLALLSRGTNVAGALGAR